MLSKIRTSDEIGRQNDAQIAGDFPDCGHMYYYYFYAAALVSIKHIVRCRSHFKFNPWEYFLTTLRTDVYYSWCTHPKILYYLFCVFSVQHALSALLSGLKTFVCLQSSIIRRGLKYVFAHYLLEKCNCANCWWLMLFKCFDIIVCVKYRNKCY